MPDQLRVTTAVDISGLATGMSASAGIGRVGVLVVGHRPGRDGMEEAARSEKQAGLIPERRCSVVLLSQETETLTLIPGRYCHRADRFGILASGGIHTCPGLDRADVMPLRRRENLNQAGLSNTNLAEELSSPAEPKTGPRKRPPPPFQKSEGSCEKDAKSSLISAAQRPYSQLVPGAAAQRVL
jgi:hypothetical protein